MWDYFDHILLRTVTFENMRTHFPIIIDTNKSRMVTRDLVYMMNINQYTFPYIEVRGFIKEDID